jgi:hypothetical protein
MDLKKEEILVGTLLCGLWMKALPILMISTTKSPKEADSISLIFPLLMMMISM